LEHKDEDIYTCTGISSLEINCRWIHSTIVPPTNDKAVKLGENNSKAKNALLNGLSDTVFTKVAHCKSTKEIWDKIRNIYEGDTKVKVRSVRTTKNEGR
jgi:hypothetical protein